MDLNTLWFILIAVLYIGFFVLEGFDFGVGMLLPFLGKSDTQRRVIINTIGPHWDANEVWLLTAGGATFAAFPQWYATFFSGFYLPLFLLLMALILRGVAFEFRSKDENPLWRATWDWAIFFGSFLPALLLGVAFANLVRGVPIDGQMQYTGGFFNLLNPYALIAGLVTVAAFLFHGAIFLQMKTSGEIQQRAQALSRRLWLVVSVLLLLFMVATYIFTPVLERLGFNPGIIPVTGAAAMLASGYFVRKERPGWAFILTSLSIASGLVTMFLMLHPDVMISSLDPAWNLTIYNAASSEYTLRTMTIVTLIFLPFVLAYQAWSYWVFRQRVSGKPESLTY
jgi:cytochrome d ubiquinol oxidase subunit II